MYMIEVVNDTPYQEGSERFFFTDLKKLQTDIKDEKETFERYYLCDLMRVYLINFNEKGKDISNNVFIVDNDDNITFPEIDVILYPESSDDYHLLNENIHSYCIDCSTVVEQKKDTICKLCLRESTCDIYDNHI